jgi:diketogulonate reductase-like aldo/keto reductase
LHGAEQGHTISAQLYQNEKEVGQAVLSQEGWKREDIWVTTKVRLEKVIRNEDSATERKSGRYGTHSMDMTQQADQ